MIKCLKKNIIKDKKHLNEKGEWTMRLKKELSLPGNQELVQFSGTERENEDGVKHVSLNHLNNDALKALIKMYIKIVSSDLKSIALVSKRFLMHSKLLFGTPKSNRFVSTIFENYFQRE